MRQGSGHVKIEQLTSKNIMPDRIKSFLDIHEHCPCVSMLLLMQSLPNDLHKLVQLIISRFVSSKPALLIRKEFGAFRLNMHPSSDDGLQRLANVTKNRYWSVAAWISPIP